MCPTTYQTISEVLYSSGALKVALFDVSLWCYLLIVCRGAEYSHQITHD